jgi:hypothetical protein
MTPWVEKIDEKSEKICYVHIKSNAFAWALPKGAILDSVASFKSKKEWLGKKIRLRSDEAKRTKNLVDSNGSLLYFVNKLTIDRNNVTENSLSALNRLSATGEFLFIAYTSIAIYLSPYLFISIRRPCCRIDPNRL